MKKVFHLKTCSTCQKILKSVDWPADMEFQNIKEQNISRSELEDIRKRLNSYEDIFSKRAMKYKSLGLKEKQLSDDDFKTYILNEYTFLKRPVIVYNNHLFVGNSKKTVESMQQLFGSK